jgi:hypothetical protein
MFTWTDGQIVDTYLRITVKADTRTNLAADDVFYFANQRGDFNGDGRVGQHDLLLLQANWGKTAANVDPAIRDEMADGRFSQNEMDAVLMGWGGRLARFTAPLETTGDPIGSSESNDDALDTQAGSAVDYAEPDNTDADNASTATQTRPYTPPRRTSPTRLVVTTMDQENTGTPLAASPAAVLGLSYTDPASLLHDDPLAGL